MIPLLEAARRVVELRRRVVVPATIRTGFLALNPLLDDAPPSLVLVRDPDAMLRAARAFAANG